MSIVPQSTNGMLKYLKKQKSPKKFKLLGAVIMWFSSIGSHMSQQPHGQGGSRCLRHLFQLPFSG